MQFYHQIITEKSYSFLQELKRQHKFILIGGWAVFLYTHALKSKDIDIIIDYPELAKMKDMYEVTKNDRLKKYEIKIGEFDIDIYLNHYSVLGVDLAEIEANTLLKEGFIIPKLELLFILKLFAWENRRGSAKGQKDELDILSLAFLPMFDWAGFNFWVERFKFLKYKELFIKMLTKTRSLPELAVNEQKTAVLRKKILSQISACSAKGLQ